ncbi:MAG: hypothetical protein JWN14_1734 [Chthonomonadales bacterium]|nr:hypothetical protein [Chthonomonadales bacterium]
MADNPQSNKTLEMRVAELEDKLAQTQITEADIKAFQKVSAAMAARAAATPAAGGAAATQPCVANTGATTPAVNAQVCVISQPCVIHQCIINHCIINHCIIHPIIHPIINPIILNDCTCGPCQQINVPAAPTAEKDFEDLGS